MRFTSAPNNPVLFVLPFVPGTYSNLENHPRLIRANPDRPPRTTTTKQIRIHLDPKTGLPQVTTDDDVKPSTLKSRHQAVDEDTASDEADSRPKRQTITRPKDESKEEKKARKHAVQEERQVRLSRVPYHRATD